MGDVMFRIVTADGVPVREVWSWGKVKGYYATMSAALKALRHCPNGARIQVTRADWTYVEL